MSSPRGVALQHGILATPTDDYDDDDDDDEIVSHATPPKYTHTQSHPPQPTSLPYGQHPSSPLNFDFCGAIRPQDLLELAACPCCTNKECIDERQLTLSSKSNNNNNNNNNNNGMKKNEQYAKSAFDSDSDEEEEMLPKGIAEGLNYHPKRILVEGWVHKKGTGQDWLGSTSWKPRWARLVMAKLEGYEVDVPLLMIYWYAGTAAPSNVIILDSTVAFPMDMDDKERWDGFRFDIRNAKTVALNTSVNRTFCAPKKARDAWIYAISQALLVFEKENDKARKAAILETRRVTSVHQMSHRPRSPPYEEAWSSDRFVSPGKNSPKKSRGIGSPPRMASPPTSPTSHNHRRHSARATIPRGPSSPLPR